MESFDFPAGALGRKSRFLRRALLLLLLAGASAFSRLVDAQATIAWSPGTDYFWQPAVAATVVALVCASLLYRPDRPPPTESLTILPSLGLLLGSSFAPAAEFLPVARISRVVVGEAFVGFSARSYLGIVLTDRADVVNAFPNCRIGMADLERVHMSVQHRLWSSCGG